MRRLLVVEDDKGIRDELCVLLGRNGYEAVALTTFDDVAEQILSAAETLFDQQGYANTTMDQIVELAGCSKGTFYHYFEAKEELACSPDLYDYVYEEWYETVKGTDENAVLKLSGLNRVFLEKLEQIFEASCDRAYADDPMEYYKDYGYRVTGYLEHEDNDTQSYLSATVNNDGVVEEITYSLDIDVNASKEDNIAQAKADLARLNRALRSADVPFLSPNLGEEHTLREDFITLFQENSYYENCRSYYDEEGLFIGYYTESQEDYNDYSSSYIYMTVEPPEEES